MTKQHHKEPPRPIPSSAMEPLRSTKGHAETYARAVTAGTVPACRWIKLACARHLRDLECGHQRGLWFDYEAEERIYAFFEKYLRHSKGEFAKKPFVLQQWQAFIVGSVFGWKRKDGSRRFRTVYDEEPRKNGKSTRLAGIGLYMTTADGEYGAEVYSAATKKDQAKIVWGEARSMVLASPELRARTRVFAANMNVPALGSKFEPLGADSDSLDGLNIHCAIIDELHAHKSRDLWDVLETATGARHQPLIYAITTAGRNKLSVCRELRDYACKVLEGIVEDDSFFAVIFTIDEDDDWSDPSVWAKANPGLGVSVNIDDLQRKVEKARHLPAAQNAFKRLHLNIWSDGAGSWLDIDAWDESCETVDPDVLAGRECYGGLDLSTTTDITAFVLVFPPVTDGERWKVLTRFWVPAENIERRVRSDRVPYDIWHDQGHIQATPGNVVDYRAVRDGITAAADMFDLREVAYDRYNSSQLVTELMDDGLTMVPFGQGFISMATPTRELEKLVISGQLAHGGNPVLRWMASNVVVLEDPAGNMKPAKNKSAEKIDGIVALIMALGRATLPKEERGGSIDDYFARLGR
ncbi:terminase large subunit [Haematospirillum sp. 15-248]|uniref:terminase large subunit n=1 Tax=Haematospirillum sp. 15-248 TaxID=2723107 RepID=UPI001ADE13E7|nr:terminase TerL endonuclease subunit [Haematospirillum sp. 15-248]